MFKTIFVLYTLRIRICANIFYQFSLFIWLSAKFSILERMFLNFRALTFQKFHTISDKIVDMTIRKNIFSS